MKAKGRLKFIFIYAELYISINRSIFSQKSVRLLEQRRIDKLLFIPIIKFI